MINTTRLYKLNSESIDFLFDHDLISERYKSLSPKFEKEIDEIKCLLELNLKSDGTYESYLYTLVHTALNSIYNEDDYVLYVDLSGCDWAEVNKHMQVQVENFKKRKLYQA